MVLTLDGEGRLGAQLYRALRRAILDGRLAPGARLPSTRVLAGDLGLARKVVVQAFEQLVAEGYADARTGSGTRVTAAIPDALLTPWRARPGRAAARQAAAPRLAPRLGVLLAQRPWPPPGRPTRPALPFDFQYGVPSLADFPHDVWARLVARRARDISLSTLRYGPTLGFDPLRRQIAGYVTRARGVLATPDQVVVVNGAQQALDLIARLMLSAGDRVVVEEPCYQAARLVFQAAGAEIVPCPVDDRGLDTDRLPDRAGVKLVYVTPSHQFPLGGILPLARRLALLRWAERAGACLVEDDYDSEFQYEQRPVEAVQGLDRSGRVLYVGTFSKLLFPSLRIGYLVVPATLVGPLAAVRLLIDYHTPTFEQAVLADFIEEGSFERHVRRSRERNRARRAALIDAFARHAGGDVEVVGTSAGVHVVGWLPHVGAGQVGHVVRAAATRGVGVYPVAPYYVRPPRRAGLLLGYANLREREIRDGVRVLAQVLREHRRRESV